MPLSYFYQKMYSFKENIAVNNQFSNYTVCNDIYTHTHIVFPNNVYTDNNSGLGT